MNENEMIGKGPALLAISNAGKKNGWTDDLQKAYLYGKYGITSRKYITYDLQPEIMEFFSNTHVSIIIKNEPSEPEDGQMDMLGRVYNKKNKSWEVNTDE